jgi:hypothetical protein
MTVRQRSMKHSDWKRASMRKATGFLPALALGVAGAISAATPSLATPITYSEIATGASGFLNGVAFTGTVTLTMNDVTSTITNPTSGIYDRVGTLILSISGIPGTATFTDTTQAAANQKMTSVSPASGFGDVTLNRNILFATNAIFSSYDLSTAIGPVSGSPSFNSTLPPSFPTSEGAFILTGASGASFTATLSTSATSAPEPSSFALLGAPLASLSLIRRRKSGLAPPRR